MKNLLILIFILLISCVNKEKPENRDQSMHTERKITRIAYADWKQSILDAIENSPLKEYQKNNLKIIIAEIKKKHFETLEEKSSSLLKVPVKQKYFTLYSAEGEILMSSFSCLHIGEEKYAKATMELEYGNHRIDASLYERTLDLSTIEPESIGTELEYRAILIISKMEKGKLISKVGYASPETDEYLGVN